MPVSLFCAKRFAARTEKGRSAQNSPVLLSDFHAVFCSCVCPVSMRVLKEEKEVEIEYMLLPDFWGFGYGTEIVKHLVELAMKNNCICSISAITDKKNIRSKRVLVKNGFKLESSFIVEDENRIAEKYRYLSSG